MDSVAEHAREKGYVTTIFGRRRYLNDIDSRNAVARGLAERNAINAPIQGSAADIMKIAMVKMHRELEARNLRSKMILQVHDEIIVDMVREEQEQVIEIVRNAMEGAAQLQRTAHNRLRRRPQLARGTLTHETGRSHTGPSTQYEQTGTETPTV